MHFIFHKVASVLYGKQSIRLCVLYGKYSTIMQTVIVVVIGMKFQMLIAVTNWFLAYLLKMRTIELFMLSTTLFLRV